ncbi:hypothetical protein [Calidifontibacter terrae]
MTATSPTLPITPTPEAAPATGAAAYRLRRTVGAICLPAMFALMLVGTALLDPLDDSAGEATTIRQAIGHSGQIAALGWAEIVTALLGLAGLMTVVGAIRRRGAGWANAVGVFAVLSAPGFIAIAMNHFVVSGLVSSTLTQDQRVEALRRFHEAGGPIIAFIMLTVVGFVLAAVAAYRSGLSSPLVLVPAAALLVTSFAPGEAGQYAAAVAGLVMSGWIARDLLRH